MTSLRSRLLTAHLLVIALTMVMFLVAVALITPRIHDRLRDDPQIGFGRNQRDIDDLMRAERIYRTALWRAMLTAGGVASLAAVLMSITVARVVASPLQAVTRASRQIASGDYSPITVSDATNEIRELAAQFNYMAGALRDAEQRRAALIGDVAHELRTPLASIEGYAEGLIDGVVVPGEKSYTIIRDEAQRMRRIVDDLQSLSRAEAGTLTLYREHYDMSQLVGRAVTLLATQISEKNARVTVVPNNDALPVYCDGDRIVQVLINLLTNALRAIESGGTVQVKVMRQHDFVACQIQDNGIGIAPEHLERIFERFYRTDPSRSRATGGTGVGLTIARAIVSAHGGTLRAMSDGIGQGATFELCLPFARAD